MFNITYYFQLREISHVAWQDLRKPFEETIFDSSRRAQREYHINTRVYRKILQQFFFLKLNTIDW